MLTLRDLVENYDLAKCILTNWKHDEDTVEECLKYYRISSNAVYPFYQDGRLCFLRFAPVTEKKLQNLQGELEFLHYLRAKGYPSLEPIPAENGEALLTLQTQWGDYYATAFYGVEGDSIEDSDFSHPVCFAYGKALGRLHKLSRDFRPTVRKQTHLDLLDQLEAQFARFHCEEGLFLVLQTLRKSLSELEQDADHYGLVHYDFECDNVFYDQASGECSVIDFDDGVYHFYALDVEKAVSSLCQEAPQALCRRAVADFLEGYETEFPYDEKARALRPIVRRFCDLHSYGKLLYCLSEAVDDPPEWMVILANKLESKAEFLKQKLLGV